MKAKGLLRQMKKANAEAAEILMNQKKPKLNMNTFDLHGFYVDEAIHYLDTILKEKVLINQNQYSTDQSNFLRIITGKGRHSADGVAKLRPAVIQFLDSNGYRYTTSPGSLKVDLRPQEMDRKECIIL